MDFRNIFWLFFLCLLFSASGLAKGNLNDDMKLFVSWFEGRFDNHLQTWLEKANLNEFPHERIHSIFKRVDLPQIGENVFFVQQYMDGDAKKIYRQRLYNFTVNKKEKALQLTIYSYDDDKKYVNSHLEPQKLSAITMANLTTIPGCEVYWRLMPGGEKFEGYMKKDGCRVVSKRSGKTIIINDDLFLTKDEIWINDQAKDEQGNYVFGNKANIHAKLKRIRVFSGWVSALKSGETTMASQDFPADAYDGKSGLTIHDQGEKIQINEKYSAELAQLIHKNGTKVLKLGIIDNESGKTIAYTWANPEAERIGINLRWISAGFTLKK